MRAPWLCVLLLACGGCVSRGYVPHYILTDSPETKEEVHKYQEAPAHIEEVVPLEDAIK